MVERALVGSSAMLYALCDSDPRGRSTGEYAFNRKVFVDVRPVDPETTARYLPTVSLIDRRMEQPRIPGQRYTHATTVAQVDDQVIVIDTDLGDSDTCTRC
jgi:hypothetical protein